MPSFTLYNHDVSISAFYMSLYLTQFSLNASSTNGARTTTKMTFISARVSMNALETTPVQMTSTVSVTLGSATSVIVSTF